MLTTGTSLMDGINRHILTIAPAINALNGYEVAVCTVEPAGELNQVLMQHGVKVYSLGYANGHRPGILRSYYKVLRDFCPDIVHLHVMAIMERIISSCCFKHIKYVQTIHGLSDAKPGKPSFKNRVEQFITRHFRLQISARCYISDGVRRALSRGATTDAVEQVCYNPIDFGALPPKSRRLQQIVGLDLETPTIGTACRIASVKNPQAFTKIMCMVLKAMPSAHAIVMGDGDADLIADCKAIIDSQGVNDRFHWLGYRADASQLVNDLDCFVMTSISEGLPTSVLECMAVETPVAMLRGNGGLIDIDILNQSTPIVAIADKDDHNALASQIVELLNNPEQAQTQARNAYAVGKANFSLESVASQLCSLYSQL